MSIIKLIITNVYLMIWIGLTIILFFATRDKSKWKYWRIIIPAILWIIACRPFVQLVLYPLESAYPILSIEELRTTGVKDIVVLTGGGQLGKNEELDSQYLQYSTMYRYLGALELCTKLGDDYRLIFSGAGKDVKPALRMLELTITLQPDRVAYMDIKSTRTRHHPEGVREFLQSDSLILVTSAYHMRRSMKVFKQAGLYPIPYPVEFLYPRNSNWSRFFPSVLNLARLQHAVYFYFASIYYMIGG